MILFSIVTIRNIQFLKRVVTVQHVLLVIIVLLGHASYLRVVSGFVVVIRIVIIETRYTSIMLIVLPLCRFKDFHRDSEEDNSDEQDNEQDEPEAPLSEELEGERLPAFVAKSDLVHFFADCVSVQLDQLHHLYVLLSLAFHNLLLVDSIYHLLSEVRLAVLSAEGSSAALEPAFVVRADAESQVRAEVAMGSWFEV